MHTANVMDYQTFRMAQVWTNTQVALTDASTFAAARRQQTGNLLDVMDPWLDPRFRNNVGLAFVKLYGWDDHGDHDETIQDVTNTVMAASSSHLRIEQRQG